MIVTAVVAVVKVSKHEAQGMTAPDQTCNSLWEPRRPECACVCVCVYNEQSQHDFSSSVFMRLALPASIAGLTGGFYFDVHDHL